jgi:hypothetical protein
VYIEKSKNMNKFSQLWQDKDYRENLANVYLTSVIKDEVEFSTMNLRLIRDAANILLKEENF